MNKVKKIYFKIILLILMVTAGADLYSQLSITVSSDAKSCVVGNGRVIVRVSGGVGNFRYQLYNRNPLDPPPPPLIKYRDVTSPYDTLVFANVAAGAYYVVVTDLFDMALTGQAFTLSTVQTNALTVPVITVTKRLSCPTWNDANLISSATGGNPPYTYLWSPGGETTAQKLGVGIGIYSVTINDSYNCGPSNYSTLFFDEVHDSFPTTLVGGTVATSQSICYNSIPAAFTSPVPASGGWGFTYQWQDSVASGIWTNIPFASAATYAETGSLTQTTYYRRGAVSTWGCGTVYSNTLSVTVFGQLIPGSIAADQTICYNTSPAAFTSVAPASGGGTISYQWQDSIASGIWNNIAGATAVTYDVPGNLTATRYYRRRASTASCGTAYSNVLTVTVQTQLVGGTIAANQNICYNTSPAAFTSSVPASGGGGFTYQWQDSVAAGTWNNIPLATGATYAETGSLTQTTYYRRSAITVSCGTAYSNILTVTVYPQLVGGIIAANQNICYNTSPAAFTSTVPASGGGGVTYQWQDSITAGTWTNIAGATAATYDVPGNLTQTTYYRRQANTVSCGTAYSNMLTVTVYAQLVPGSIAADQTICYNTSPAAFTSTAPASGGGTITYQWQDSVASGTWNNIAGATAATYDVPGNLTATRYYRRRASTPSCGTVYSNVLTVTVYPQLVGGTIAANQSICYNTSPVAFTSTVPASGGGGVTYQWQDSITSGTWTIIAGATAVTYDVPGNLTQTTYYRRQANTVSCGTAYSNTLTVIVYGQLIPGSIAADQTICYNTSPAAFTSVTPASGGGTIAYQWQDSVAAGTWNNIAGATAATYDVPGNLTATRYYRRQANTVSCGSAYSNILTVTVNAQLVGGTIASNQNICYNTSPAAFTSTTPASGGGAIAYQWQDSVASGSWTNIAGATLETYDVPGNLTATRYYRRRASTVSCGTVYSNMLTVTVYPQLVGGTIAANQNICYNTSPAAFTSTVPASGGGTITYQWQDSVTSGTWTIIAGATAAAYDVPGNLTATRYYRRRANTVSCGTAYSNILTVTVYAQLVPGSIAANQNICYNTSPAAFTSTVPASGGGTITYQWQDSIASGTWNNISGATAATYNVPGNLTTTRYYRRSASTPSCGTVYSNMLTVTVYPQLVGGTIAANQSICYNTSPAAFTSTVPASGGGTITYQWQDSVASGIWTNIAGATAATYNVPGNLTATRYYRRRASTVSCGTAYSNILTVTVNAQLVPGSIAADQTLCYNTSPVAFTSVTPASGGGTITYQWQDSIASGTWNNISGATAATYDVPGNLTATRYYRRRASTPSCGTVYSNILTVTVNTQLVGGTIAADQSICYNTSPAAFTSSVAASGGGGVTYQWQDSVPSGIWTNIAGATAETYDVPGNLTATRYYRRQANTVSCGTAFSNILIVTVNTQLVGGTIATDQDICYNTSPAAFTSSVPASGGGGVTYQWQDSITSGTWTIIAGATAVTYDVPGNLTQTTYYRRQANTVSCGTAYSNTLTVTVYGQLIPGSIAADQTICYNTSPAAFTSVTPASGGGTIAYQWQDSVAAGTWNNIAGAIAATYDVPGNLTATRYYRRQANTISCGSAYSNILTVTVNPQLLGGTIAANQNICYNTSPVAFTSTVPASGGGGVTYLWQDSITSGTWTNIASATLETYDVPGNLTQTTYYRRQANTVSCGTVYSNTLTVTVYDQLVPGSIAADQTICYNTSPVAFTSTVPASGGGTISYQWQDSIAAGTWNNISGATAAAYDVPGNLTQTIYYRRMASTVSCGSVYSNMLTVTVNAQLLPGSIAANQNICYGTSPAAFTSPAPASGGGTITYQWQDSIASGIWTNIGGATLETYNVPGNLIQTTYYRRSAITASCGTAYSNTVTVTVIALPFVEAGPTDTVCYATTDFHILNATASDYSTLQWSVADGSGSFQGGIVDILDPTYLFSTQDKNSGYGSLVRLALTAEGNGTCGGHYAFDTLDLFIVPEINVSIGEPAPFLIGPNTEIEVCVQVSGHQRVLDMGYYLVAPDGYTTMILKRGPMEINYSFPCTPYTSGIPGNVDICFSTESSVPLDICTEPRPLTGTFEAEGNWNILYGSNPARGGWAVMVKDTAPNMGGVDGNIIEASITFTDTATATHELTAIDYQSGAINIPILEPARNSYIISRDIQVSCSGECDAIAIVNTIGGVLPYIDYTWSPLPTGGNGTDSVVLCAGTYDLTVEDAMNCTGSASVNVLSPPPIIIDTVIYTDTIGCYGDSSGMIVVVATGGTGTIRYLLLPDSVLVIADTGLFTNLPAGSYQVDIIDSKLCYETVLVDIAQRSQLVIDAIVTNTTYCIGDSTGAIEATASGGTPPYTYILWPTDTVNNTGEFNNLGPGTYVAKAVDFNNCDTTDGDTIIIGVPYGLYIDTVLVSPIACFGQSGSLTVLITGGLAPYSISLTGGPSPYPPNPNDSIVFNGLGAGVYNIVVTDANACSDTFPTAIILTEPPALALDSIFSLPVDKCYTDATGEISVYASGGWGNIEYSLDNIIYQSGNTFPLLPGGDYTVYYHDSTCIHSTNVSIASPDRVMGNPTVSDIGGGLLGQIVFNATGGYPGESPNEYLYSIDSGYTTTNNPSFTGLDTGTYYLFVWDTAGCPWDSVVHISRSGLNVTVQIINAACYGTASGEIRLRLLDGTPPYQVWLNSQLIYGDALGNPVTGNLATIPTLRAGTYLIEVEDAFGLWFSSTRTINQPVPIVPVFALNRPTCHEFELDGSVSDNGEIHVTSTQGAGGYEYQWEDSGTTDSNRVGLTPGLYRITVTDQNTCSTIDSVNLEGNTIIAAEMAIRSVDDLSISPPGVVSDTIGCYLSRWQLFVTHLGSGATSYIWSPDYLYDSVNYLSNASEFMTIRGYNTFGITVYDSAAGCYDYDEMLINMYDTIGMHIFSDYRFGDSIFIPSGATIDLMSPDGFDDYLWTGEGSIDDDLSPSISYSSTYNDMVVVMGYMSVNGCYEYDTAYIVIQQPIRNVFTVFTPNNDGYNDYWTISETAHQLFFSYNVEVYIYNRWGQLIFHSDHYGIDDSNRWYGKSMKNNKDLPVGTYYFIINPNNGEQEQFSGTVTIVR